MNSEFLSNEINTNLSQSDVDGGYWTKDLVGKIIEVQTKNTTYKIDFRGDKPTIIGHYKYCPEPTVCSIHGSTWGGSMLNIGWIGKGMNLEFSLKGFARITTSTIQYVREISPEGE